MPNETAALLADLNSRLAAQLSAARSEGRASALDEVRSLVVGAPARRGPGRPRGSTNKSKPTERDERRNSWSRLTPNERLARVNAIRRAKGLPPK